jgi:predicted kinase
MSTTTANASATPTMHFLCGKMAAGKSTLSKKLAAEFEAVLICEDLWLSRLYADEIHTFEDYLKYSARLKEVLTPHLLDLLKQGNSVVLDFPGNVPRQRQWFRTIFEAAGADHVLHFVDVPDDLERLTKPSGQGASSKTVRWYGETVQRRHEGFVRRSYAGRGYRNATWKIRRVPR